jgi:hypothetical protein
VTCVRCTCELPAKLHDPGPKPHWCIRCQPYAGAARSRRYYAAHREAVRARVRGYYQRRRALTLNRRRRTRRREAPP